MAATLRPSPRLRVSRRAYASAMGLSRPFSASCTRRKHQVPALENGDQWAAHGIPGLFSRQGFDIAWTQKQADLIQQLNERTEGTPDEGNSAKELLIKHARQPEKAALFNYASMAHNNNFFFSCLASEEVNIPNALHEHFELDFSSIETLKAEFLATGKAMFGPGFVWLVKMAAGELNSYNSKFRILATYSAGSPYPGAHYRRQPVDMNTQNNANSADLLSRDLLNKRFIPNNTVGSAGRYSKFERELAQKAPGGANLTAVLCVNVWEHAWLHDFGVAGKGDYLEAWWKRINWERVFQNADVN